ncbi:MAG: aromatic ring-hydroxylating dioxygenase subunit alpha [Gammaproteobacteria bacterium]|nr:aromatic ring-hydroxylating dioxygenase subunit alpha [Gammaproteobacteria bacterium]MDH3447371.1 aromatic ring-hydroxylating dioxygenase subunit alpha [Gammaproteobacteria bacterium]
MSGSLLPGYWYVVAESRELTCDSLLSRQVLDVWIACYRDAQGNAVIAEDRCLHRCARLSNGKVRDGELTCGYHGWVYGEAGKVIAIPGEGGAAAATKRNLQAKAFSTREQDGYVYVCLQPGAQTPATAFVLPRPEASGWRHLRLQNRFRNSMVNCVENYIDVPHTAYVHHGVFRKPRQQQIQVSVSRSKGHVRVQYLGETMNLGSFAWFLNPKGGEIEHEDNFYAPNVTSVHYRLPRGYSYIITSQSVPVSDMETLVYTDISYYFGRWTALAGWITRRQAQTVINQDIDILNQQAEVIEKYGENFFTTAPDIIHSLTSEIITALQQGTTPAELPDQKKEVRFWV